MARIKETVAMWLGGGVAFGFLVSRCSPRYLGWRAGRMLVNCSVAVPLWAAALHYTSDDAPINKRSWKSPPAIIEGHLVTAAAPPADATVWFLTVTDEREAIVSDGVTICGK